MIDSCWLPALEYFSNYSNDWEKYEDALYKIFKRDFIDNPLFYNNLIVKIKKYPIEYHKEEAFFHITCKNYDDCTDRVPDFRRCERIRWVRAIIENYSYCTSKCEDCSGVKIWSEPYKTKMRIHLLLEKERYMVVLEKREKYYLLITAFYFEYENALKKQLNHYNKYCALSYNL